MLLSIILTIILLVIFITGLHNFNYPALLGLFLLIIGSSYYATRSYIKKSPDKEALIMKIYPRWVLVFYFFFLFSLTFSINRTSAGITFGSGSLRTRFLEKANLIPFKTIRGMLSSKHFSSYAFFNIIGNIGALLPLGFLFPIVFPKARRLLPYTLMIIGVILFIESVQFLFGVGKPDIDDLILNLAGAIPAFLIYSAYTVRKTGED